MLKKRIITVLAGVFDTEGYLETGCRQEAGIAMKSRPGDVEWSEAVSDLIRAGYVETAQDPLTGDRRLKLTDAGRAYADAHC